MNLRFRPFLAILLLALAGTACSQNDAAVQATIRKALSERLPNLPKIDEITRSPVEGLWEVRYGGTEIIYSDAKGDFVFANGSLVDTKTRTDLTQARIEKLLAIDWAQMPLKDAIAIKQGTGARKMAVFVDPNCGYCKRFERDLTTVKDVTIYTFLLPILGADSMAKSRDILCAKDPAVAWRAWMLDGVLPAKAVNCDTSAIERTLEFGTKQRVNGTPAVFFTDGTRRPGAISADSVERLLTAAAAKK
ncbi:DsbC family protein [Rubrivivax rivuli]|uniref:Thiol:disulfide interchange protein n=1 Tax=Rubrivivax rivuli TaxID=1862385 RepID=A0A437R9M1_9BURK|nr:DsbC family protein [Rubrivivax rivuli]RVU43415.1 DsbC family protein [Rubrivivax rivuli]